MTQFQDSIDGFNRVKRVGFGQSHLPPLFVYVQLLAGANAEPPSQRLENGYLPSFGDDCFHTVRV